MSMDDPPLIEASLLKGLSESERAEALAAAAAAKRAEERAEQRAIQRALERKERERRAEKEREEQLELERREKRGLFNDGGGGNGSHSGENGGGKVQFISRKRRAEMKLENRSNGPAVTTDIRNEISSKTLSNGGNSLDRNRKENTSNRRDRHQLTTAELKSIKKTYLGEKALHDEDTLRQQQLEKQRRSRQKKKITFKFEWDASEDTSAGADVLPQLHRLKRDRRNMPNRSKSSSSNADTIRNDVSTKPLHKMTSRDWRILRENYDISVRGGKAPPPLRNFRESSCANVPPIHKTLLYAIEKVMKYKAPSPIQRQAIPIGLQRRDLIGIAETGSGKTAAFGIPLCHLIFSLPPSILDSVAESGPLALIMAPTRELALQIDVEIGKLLSGQKTVKTAAIVGGQPIQAQATVLRNGVHIVVGTPGRINDCIESSYLVLNQCSYIVLDEADRMIDLGFAPQIEGVLNAMGCQLKSENEKEAYEQERMDLENIKENVPTHRLTAMFSATMPPEVQRMAKQYLRHPAVVKVGDTNSGKNQRIEQRVIFLSSPKQKEKSLREVLLNKTRIDDKVLVFVNEKKHADGVGRIVERIGRRCVVLHGGKTQEHREESLATFRRGGYVLVATDVAGRGLDIPNIKHVVNYDVPSRSIDNYCHRIGRTGRAGAQGFATSFITDEDEGIMAALKGYLESTGAPIPDRLARHPAASGKAQFGGHIR